jgi:hypothetical protein
MEHTDGGGPLGWLCIFLFLSISIISDKKLELIYWELQLFGPRTQGK